MGPLELVQLTGLMRLTSGDPKIAIGLIDGPVAADHADLRHAHIRVIPESVQAACTHANSVACVHGTFIAGILSAGRDSAAPAICPDCTLWVRPIFSASTTGHALPGATPRELARAITDCVGAGARVINLSAALTQSAVTVERELTLALDHAAQHGVLVVAASGNQATVGSTAITRHPWVIPVIGYDLTGQPVNNSNVGHAIGRRGLGGPGGAVTSLGTHGHPLTMGGTSVAAPFVTGTIALLWSLFPAMSAGAMRDALTPTINARRTGVVPPLLNAQSIYQALSQSHESR
jgi:subtilisin family serine protease